VGADDLAAGLVTIRVLRGSGAHLQEKVVRDGLAARLGQITRSP